MKSFHTFLQFAFLLCSGCITEIISDTVYGESLVDIKSAIRKTQAAWKPAPSPIFASRTDREIKSFLGVDLMKRLKSLKEDDSTYCSTKNQFNDDSINSDQKGRSYFGSGRGRWLLSTRYKAVYWRARRRKTNYAWSKRVEDTWKKITQRLEQKCLMRKGRMRNKRQIVANLPQNFDWRQNTRCKSIDDIRFQQCGDCWSVASTSVMSDRYCLWTRIDKFFSAKQVTTCTYGPGAGCDGGYPLDAMIFYYKNGVASGGDPTVLDEIKGCLPYPLILDNSTKCQSKCDSYLPLDITKAGSYFEITTKNATEILSEIYRYGPVVAIFEVFEDFLYYQSGVYKHVFGKSYGYHAIRLLGYGVDETNTPYWLGANSWGKDWGNLGYFKFVRGINHCNIEAYVTTVFPIEAYK